MHVKLSKLKTFFPEEEPCFRVCVYILHPRTEKTVAENELDVQRAQSHAKLDTKWTFLRFNGRLYEI